MFSLNAQMDQPSSSISELEALVRVIDGSRRDFVEKLVAEEAEMREKEAQLQAEYKARAEVERKAKLQKGWIAFPLEKLPGEIFLEVVAKLAEREHKRHLMQTCPKFRSLLHGKRSKLLDCRLPCTKVTARLLLDRHPTIEIEANSFTEEYRSGKCYFRKTPPFPCQSNDLPERVMKVLRLVADNLEVQETAVQLGHELSMWPTHLISSLLEEVSKHSTLTILHYPFRHNEPVEKETIRKLWTMIQNCPGPIYLKLCSIGRSLNRDANRILVENVLIEEARRKGISVMFQREDDFAFPREYRLEVNKDGKTLTIVRHKWDPENAT